MCKEFREMASGTCHRYGLYTKQKVKRPYENKGGHMIKRTPKETTMKWCGRKSQRETVTETTEDDDTRVLPALQIYQETS